jgi:biopolymer transport protein TolQ
MKGLQKMVMGNSLWLLVKQSDAISKLVLLVLLIMSIVGWAIFLYKFMVLRLKKRQLDQAIARIKNLETFDQIIEATAALSGTLPGQFLSKNLSYLKGVLETNKERGVTTLSAHQWDLLQQNIYQVMEDAVQKEESLLPFLLTSFDSATLLGLFGTIWGLIHAFIRISERQAADITTVAPGIAEALITTLAGLMVAIPALFMFNYLQAKISQLEQRFGILADKLNHTLQRLFIR